MSRGIVQVGLALGLGLIALCGELDSRAGARENPRIRVQLKNETGEAVKIYFYRTAQKAYVKFGTSLYTEIGSGSTKQIPLEHAGEYRIWLRNRSGEDHLLQRVTISTTAPFERAVVLIREHQAKPTDKEKQKDKPRPAAPDYYLLQPLKEGGKNLGIK